MSGVATGVVAPILGFHRAIGIVAAYWTRPRKIRREQENFIESIANLLAIATKLNCAEEALHNQSVTLEHLLEALAVRGGLDSFLTSAVAEGAKRLNATSARLWIHNPAKNVIYVHALYRDGGIQPVRGSGYPSAIEPIPAPSVPSWREMAESGKPLLITHAFARRRLEQETLPLADTAPTVIRIPLVHRGKIQGAVGFSLQVPMTSLPEDLGLLNSLFQHITLAVRLKRLADRARDRAVFEERNRLAMEIHDTLAQSFTSVAIQLEVAQKHLADASHDTLTAQLRRAQLLAREGLAEARRSIWALRPRALEQSDLAAALKRSAMAFFAGTAIRPHYRSHVTARPLAPGVEVELLRIAHEAMTNVLKHSGAARVYVSLVSTPELVEIRIRDNGQGFAPHAEESDTAVGLKAMRERAQRAGAEIQIDSLPGKGTCVAITRCVASSSNEEIRAYSHSAGR